MTHRNMPETRAMYGTETERCRRMTSPMAARAYVREQARLAAEGAANGKNQAPIRAKEFYSRAQYDAWLRKMSKNPAFEVVDTATSVMPRLTVLTVTYRT